MHSNHRLGHLFSAKKSVGGFVRTRANRFGFCSFAPFASASLFLPFQLACDFLLGLHQLVHDQQTANTLFNFVGPNMSPDCFPVNR